MKNRLKKRKENEPMTQKSNICAGRRIGIGLKIGILYILCSVCPAVFIFGCNKSVQATWSQPEAVSLNELVPEATRIVQEGLADPNPYIRVNAIEVVATTKQTKLMPEVRQLLKDDIVPVRFAAVLAVGDSEYSLAESSIRQLLKDEDENVAIAAAYALSKLGFPENFEILHKAITSKDQTVRANAALLLGKSGDKSPETRKSLWLTLRRKDSDDRVILQTAEYIAMLGDERVYPKLWTMLISAYADVRVIGIRAMGALGTVQSKNALITMLDDDILEVRLAAAEQLGMLGDTTGEPVVLDIFTKNLTAGLDKEAQQRINVFAALAIGRIGTPSLTRFLPQLLNDESKSVRIAAAKAVLQWIMQNRTAEKTST